MYCKKFLIFFGISLATLLDKKTQDEKNNETEKSKNDTSANILEVTVENIRKNKELKERTRMVREHLFKAKRANWRKLPKEEWWVEGNLVWSNDSFEEYQAIIIPQENSDMFTKSEHGDLGFENWYLVDPETVCQYTGLMDKNDRKIFENDIVDVVFLEAREGALVKNYQYKVEFNQEEASYELTGNDELLGRPCFVSANQNLMEIIDNIFDNLEFLKDGQQLKKDRKARRKMNKDLEEYLTEKKDLYQERIARLEKEERDIHELLEREPGREDALEDLNTVIKLQDRYNALIDFITELQESYF